LKKKSLREWKLVFNTNVTYALIYVFALFTLFCYSKVTLLALSVPNEGYLFQKCVVRTKFDIRLHYHHWIDTSACGLLVLESIIRPVFSDSALTWFIRYIFFLSKMTFLKSCNYY
jgi:hypothetical protein